MVLCFIGSILGIVVGALVALVPLFLVLAGPEFLLGKMEARPATPLRSHERPSSMSRFTEADSCERI